MGMDRWGEVPVDEVAAVSHTSNRVLTARSRRREALSEDSQDTSGPVEGHVGTAGQRCGWTSRARSQE